MWVTQSHTFSPSLLLIRLYHMSQLSLYFLYYLQLSDELSYSDNSIMSFKPVVSLICYLSFLVAALAMKSIDYEYKAVHLVKDGGEQVS